MKPPPNSANDYSKGFVGKFLFKVFRLTTNQGDNLIAGKKVLAVVPARKGSKGLPGKNTLNLCGKPLILWTLEKAKISKYIDNILVTTDSSDTQEIAINFGVEAPFLRPQNLSSDTASSIDVVKHCLDFYEKEYLQTFDLVILLEPTSPLREDRDIDQMLEILVDNYENFDSIISVGEVSEHPSILKSITGKYLSPYCPDLPQNSRRQDNEPAYFPYGVAYIAKVISLKKENTFYTKRSTFFEISRYQNFEIDDIYDFWNVEKMMQEVWGIK